MFLLFFTKTFLSGIFPLRNHPYVWQRASLNKGKMLSSPLIDLYSFSNDLISQHNVIGFRGPLHIYDGKLLNIYNPNEISWGRDIEKMKGERRFAFIPVALPHCTPLPLPPTSSLSFSFSFLHTFSPLQSVSQPFPQLLFVSSSHITSVPPVVHLGMTS